MNLTNFNKIGKKLTITSQATQKQYRRKVTLLFTIIITSFVITPFISWWALYDSTTSLKQTLELMDDSQFAASVHAGVSGYAEHANGAEKILGGLQDVAYSPNSLQSTIAEELLTSGISVESFSVKNIPQPNKAKFVPNKDAWKNFDLAIVSIAGTIGTSRLPECLLFLSTREKLWYISSLEMRPMDNPAELVSKFRKVETEISTKGRAFERDSLIDLISKRANKNTLSISLSFIVPIQTGQIENEWRKPL